MRDQQSAYVTQEPAVRRKRRFSLSFIWAATITAGVGALVGSQIYDPVKRVIEAIVGLIFIFMLWNVSTLNALWLLIIIHPFPFAISLGNSNFVFTLIIFIIYLIRVSRHSNNIRSDRLVNLPIALLVLSYIVSFYNIEVTPYIMRFALVHTSNFFVVILFFYLVINFVDDEEKLRKTLRVVLVTASLVILFTLLELLFPGKQIIPGWLYSKHQVGLVTKGLRMQGPYHDFELTAEFFSLMSFLIFYMVIRARSLLLRTLYTMLLIADLFMMFTTVTRGAFFSLIAGLTYLAYISRKELNFVRFISLAAAFVILIVSLDVFVSKYTVSGSLFQRVVNTTFEKGFVPKNRALAWGGNIERGMEHPFIGHGPGWDFTKGITTKLWPHNAYLYYFNITGFFGLGAFLFLLYRLFKITYKARNALLGASSFALGFMKIMHVVLITFMIDQIKIDYLRNDIYMYTIWLLFALIVATKNILAKEYKEFKLI